MQPDGGWGWSNAGFIRDGDESLLVDTLFDEPLTAKMLDAIEHATGIARGRIGRLVNTHANGDHCRGNALVPSAEVIASAAATAEMSDLPPEALADMKIRGRAGTAGEAGDTLAWVPGDRTVFTGDLLFADRTPIMWARPVATWLAACDRIRALGAEWIVPGHGALADAGFRSRLRHRTGHLP